MTKIVINTCFGGFGLSEAAIALYFEKAGLIRYTETSKFGSRCNYYKKEGEKIFWSVFNLQRDDPILVKVVTELGAAANGEYAELEIVEIPDDVLWEINEYDGVEHIAEQHRTWS